jgi:3-polyprenyl-4-hydroxybenzoate decarboxylase
MVVSFLASRSFDNEQLLYNILQKFDPESDTLILKQNGHSDFDETISSMAERLGLTIKFSNFPNDESENCVIIYDDNTTEIIRCD